jgi:hypothetical protein
VGVLAGAWNKGGVAATGAFALLAGESVKQAADWESSMNKMASAVDMPMNQIKDLQDRLLSLSPQVGKTLDTLGVPPVVSLTNVSATGAGTALDGLSVRQNATIAVTTSAGVSAGSVQLQGSLDGVNFFDLGSPVSTTAASTTTQVVVSNAYARYVRANVGTSITGGTISASVGLSG